MDKVYAWLPNPPNVGHGSLDIAFGEGAGKAEYVSWWPGDLSYFKPGHAIINTYPDDVGSEGGQPDRAVEIKCLDAQECATHGCRSKRLPVILSITRTAPRWSCRFLSQAEQAYHMTFLCICRPSKYGLRGIWLTWLNRLTQRPLQSKLNARPGSLPRSPEFFKCGRRQSHPAVLSGWVFDRRAEYGRRRGRRVASVSRRASSE